jgi:hypothetical protein
VVIVGGPAWVIALLRRQLAPEVVVHCDGARRPHRHRQDWQASAAERPYPRTSLFGGAG